MYLVFPVMVIVILAMFTFQFCPRLQDKHCREHYDHDRENLFSLIGCAKDVINIYLYQKNLLNLAACTQPKNKNEILQSFYQIYQSVKLEQSTSYFSVCGKKCGFSIFFVKKKAYFYHTKGFLLQQTIQIFYLIL